VCVVAAAVAATAWAFSDMESLSLRVVLATAIQFWLVSAVAAHLMRASRTAAR
jgi:hypothetical protein